MDKKRVELEIEEQLGIYLNSIYKVEANSKFERINYNTEEGKKLQLAGVDLIKVEDDKNDKIYIDEKARLTHINNDEVSTFVFELDFINRAGELSQGWFYNKNQLTNRYHLITKITTNNLRNTAKDIYNIVYNDNKYDGQIVFNSLFIRSLDKKEFQNELSLLGLNEEKVSKYYRHKIRQIIKHLQNNVTSEDIQFIKESINKIEGVRKLEPIIKFNKFQGIKIFVDELKNRDGWFHYTHYLREKPINLVIKDNLIDNTPNTFVIK